MAKKCFLKKYKLLDFFLKIICILFICFISLRYVKLCGRVWRMIETLHYFTTRGWNFESTNIVKLWDSMSKDDQKVKKFY